jgi:glycosyltransferase involved in cell wall biosynthesis
VGRFQAPALKTALPSGAARGMRIAWVIYGALDQRTGGYIYDRIVVDGLTRSGDDVRVVSLAPHGVRGVLRGPALARELRALVCDAVVGDELCFPELSTAFPRLANAGARVLVVHHLSSWEHEGNPAKRVAVRHLEHTVLQASDARIATSAYTATRLAREHHVDAVVAEPGADRLPRATQHPDHDRKSIELLFVGTQTPRKGVRVLLEAIQRAHAFFPQDTRLRLTLAGDATRDPVYAAEVRAQIARSPELSRTVHVAGVLDDIALAARLAASDALVLPSFFEGYGMVITEALAQGTPVIATLAGAIPSIVRDGAEAILVPPNDVDALSAALIRFVTNAELRASMKTCAETRCRTLPCWSDTIATVRATLQAVIAATTASSWH